MDIGCNNGLITIAFGKNLGLENKQIFGIDVNNFGEQQIKPISGFEFTYYDGYNIPFEDNTFDLITCSMVLHHVKYQHILLAEIRRVMKPAGIFFIKEHNCYDDNLYWLILLEHLLYDVLDHHIGYDEFIKSYYLNLHSEKEFTNIISSYGFTKKNIESDHIKNLYYSYNPTKHYYSIFVKNEL